jgi:hypothetical protein
MAAIETAMIITSLVLNTQIQMQQGDKDGLP